MKSGLNRVWQAWKRFGQLMGDFIGRLVLTLFYFTIFMPFGLGVRLLGDRLDVKGWTAPTWTKRVTRDLDMKDARRQA
jgi:hypothetical protein